MKRTWVIPGLLLAGLAGLGGLTHAASAHDNDWRGGHGYMGGEGPGDYGWSGQRWRDDRRDDDRRPRWRDDDRPGYGPREGRRGDDDQGCGPRGRGHGRMGGGMHHGYGGREGMGRGYGMHRGDGPGMGGGHGMHRGDGPGMGRGYGMHRGGEDRGPGYGRMGAADPAELDSLKKELSITAQQEAAWTKYAGAVKEAGDAMRTRREAMRAGAARNLSPDDHRKFRDSMMEQRRKEIDAVKTAADELVKTLDEKQVAIAKEVLPGYAVGPTRGAGMGFGGGRHH